MSHFMQRADDIFIVQVLWSNCEVLRNTRGHMISFWWSAAEKSEPDLQARVKKARKQVTAHPDPGHSHLGVRHLESLRNNVPRKVPSAGLKATKKINRLTV
jgi:hypothetical protein